MWVVTSVTLQDLAGNEDEYEIGADVEGYGCSRDYDVGEPTFSAPGGELETSRLAADPQDGTVFPVGWSDAVEEALAQAYTDRLEDMYSSKADHDYDTYKEGGYDD